MLAENKIVNMIKRTGGKGLVHKLKDGTHIYGKDQYIVLDGEDSGLIRWGFDFNDSDIPDLSVVVAIDDLHTKYNNIINQLGKYPSFMSGLDLNQTHKSWILNLRNLDNTIFHDVNIEIPVIGKPIGIRTPHCLYLHVINNTLYLSLRNENSLRFSPQYFGITIFKINGFIHEDVKQQVNIAFLPCAHLFRTLYSIEYLRDLIYYVEEPLKIGSTDVLLIIDREDRTLYRRNEGNFEAEALYYFVDKDENVYIYTLEEDVYVLILTCFNDDNDNHKYNVMSADEVLPKLNLKFSCSASITIESMFKNLK